MNSLEKARETINRVDSEMAALFTERMRAAELVAAYKKEHGLPITDAEREAAVIRNGAQQVDDPILREYYVRFIQELDPENLVCPACGEKFGCIVDEDDYKKISEDK